MAWPSQSLLVHHVLHHSHHHGGPPLDFLFYICIFPTLGKTALSFPDVLSLHGWEQPLFSTCWLIFSYGSPGCCWPSLLQGQCWLTCCLPVLPNFFLEILSYCFSLQMAILYQMRDAAPPLIGLHEVPASPALQSAKAVQGTGCYLPLCCDLLFISSL